MPNFKPKTDKKIVIDKKSIQTLDRKHSEKLRDFESKKKKILKWKKQKKALREHLLNNHGNHEENIEIRDKIRFLSKKIKEVEKEKRDYDLNNSQLIFDYFERKKNIVVDNNKKKMVSEFFKVQEPKKKSNDNDSKLSSAKQYFMNLDESYIDIKDFVTDTKFICKSCGGEQVPIEHEGIVVCKKCGMQDTYLVEHEKPSYKEPPKEVCFYAYKRINHFREILAQFQAKETTQIDQKVFDDIKKQIKKERITLDQLTNDKAKQILKNLGYNKFYEHIPFIKEKLGIKPPTMSVELEQKLCNLFLEIQKPYAKFCPNERVNFLNYYYVLYKLCELLDEDHYLQYFYMLKDPVKRMEQDEIWKKICGELHWEYIPTL